MGWKHITVGCESLETNGDTLKLAKLGSEYEAINVYVKHEDTDKNELTNEAVQSPLDEPVLSPLDEPVDSLLDSPIDELVDDEIRSEGSNSDMNVDIEEDDDAWLHEKVQSIVNVGNASGQNVGNDAGSSARSIEDNAIKKNVRSYASSFAGSAEGNVGRIPTSSSKNGNSTGKVNCDSDELVSLSSSYNDGDTLTILIYSLVVDQLEFSVGMKFSSQTAFKEYLVEYALKGGYNIRFIKMPRGVL
ncbi:hypothetical protein FEM48_Zijuj11G0060000 [Ziziphus jujuba var. spinosa]|uniref:Uncharacterized protein n=1 Tax=Ziziphus jujuba var. spinosa TaxID=714518 RepID=A0A978UH87_ZIZJJ|nr:hypothetical protein FEM48_Zijuj11G0060000 [Ziziphus jujuba var. spinosa]